MSEPGKTYEVCWYTHDKLHFLGIDLEAFAQALKPYLEPTGCSQCHKTPNKVEEKIREIVTKRVTTESMYGNNLIRELRELVALARETK